MQIIEILALDNGAHRNQSGDFRTIPEGWAVVPYGETLENFPFGTPTVEEINGVMTVTAWEVGEIPEAEPEPEAEPTQIDVIEAQVYYTAMMTDTLLEE